MDKSISPEREIKRKLNKMRKTPSSRLELRLKLNKMLKDGQLTEEEYKMLLYIYVKDLYIENACDRLGMSESTFYYHWKSIMTKLVYIF